MDTKTNKSLAKLYSALDLHYPPLTEQEKKNGREKFAQQQQEARAFLRKLKKIL